MGAILKTLPTRFARGDIERFLGLGAKKPAWCNYYFTLGRGRPRRDGFTLRQLYFTHKGIVIGYFDVAEVVQNVGQLPQLTNMDGDPSAWQIPGDAWVAVCPPPFHPLRDRVFHHGFQGWRYFDLQKYRSSLDARIRL